VREKKTLCHSRKILNLLKGQVWQSQLHNRS